MYSPQFTSLTNISFTHFLQLLGIIKNNQQQYQYQQTDPHMSIYSGFATRNQQQNYDECVETVLYIFQKRLLKFYKGQMADEEKFVNVLNKIFIQMKSMQAHKYLQPKSSNTFEELLLFLKKKELHDASVNENKNYQIDKLDSSQLNLRHPIVQVNTAPPRDAQKPLPEPRDKNIKSGINRTSKRDIDRQIENQSRPKTTSNIRKRVASKAAMNANHNKISGRIEQDSKIQGKDSPEQNNQNESNLLSQKNRQYQNLLNSSASKLIRMSRNQPRTYLNNSHQAITLKKRSTINSKQKNTEENIQEERDGEKSRSRDADVRDLIKGYINKTKKSYIRGFNRRKQEIDDMLKFI